MAATHVPVEFLRRIQAELQHAIEAGETFEDFRMRLDWLAIAPPIGWLTKPTQEDSRSTAAALGPHRPHQERPAEAARRPSSTSGDRDPGCRTRSGISPALCTQKSLQAPFHPRSVARLR
eukprot:TRINITY_DN10196_c0_g1_i5.p1 TRINITY_DN10196_c0_g1~~TRINITY_DN10196_c0_g1_i5.p1  ORF type:complete len:120 (+),score=3.07 TRINITY_DN10196_c0_g1_i5:236-595(+)